MEDGVSHQCHDDDDDDGRGISEPGLEFGRQCLRQGFHGLTCFVIGNLNINDDLTFDH